VAGKRGWLTEAYFRRQRIWASRKHNFTGLCPRDELKPLYSHVNSLWCVALWRILPDICWSYGLRSPCPCLQSRFHSRNGWARGSLVDPERYGKELRRQWGNSRPMKDWEAAVQPAWNRQKFDWGEVREREPWKSIGKYILSQFISKKNMKVENINDQARLSLCHPRLK